MIINLVLKNFTRKNCLVKLCWVYQRFHYKMMQSAVIRPYFLVKPFEKARCQIKRFWISSRRRACVAKCGRQIILQYSTVLRIKLLNNKIFVSLFRKPLLFLRTNFSILEAILIVLFKCGVNDIFCQILCRDLCLLPEVS